MLGRATTPTTARRLAAVFTLVDCCSASTAADFTLNLPTGDEIDCPHTFVLRQAGTACGEYIPVPDAETCEYAAKVCSGKILTASGSSGSETDRLPAGDLTFSAVSGAARPLAGCSISANADPLADRIVAYKASDVGAAATSGDYRLICLKSDVVSGSGGRAVMLPAHADLSNGFDVVKQCHRGFDLEFEMCAKASLGPATLTDVSTVAPPSSGSHLYRSCFVQTSGATQALVFFNETATTPTTTLQLGSQVVTDGSSIAANQFRAVCKAFVPRGKYELLPKFADSGANRYEGCAAGFELPGQECTGENAQSFGEGVSEVVGLSGSGPYAYWQQSRADSLTGTPTYDSDLFTTNRLGCFFSTELSASGGRKESLSFSHFFRRELGTRDNRARIGHSVCLSQQMCNGGRYVVLPPGRACAHGFELHTTSAVAATNDLLLAQVQEDCQDALLTQLSPVDTLLTPLSTPPASTGPAGSSIRIDARTMTLSLSASSPVAAYQHAVCHRSLPCTGSSYGYEILPPGQQCHAKLETTTQTSVAAATLRADITDNCLPASNPNFALSTTSVETLDTSTARSFYIMTADSQYQATPAVPKINVELRQNVALDVNKEDYPICLSKVMCSGPALVDGTSIQHETHTAGVTNCPTASAEVQSAAECHALGTYCAGDQSAATSHVASDALPIGCSIVDSVDGSLTATLVFNEGGPLYKERAVLPRLLQNKRHLRKVCRVASAAATDAATSVCSQMHSRLSAVSASHVANNNVADEYATSEVTMASKLDAEVAQLVVVHPDPLPHRGAECMQLLGFSHGDVTPIPDYTQSPRTSWMSTPYELQAAHLSSGHIASGSNSNLNDLHVTLGPGTGGGAGNCKVGADPNKLLITLWPLTETCTGSTATVSFPQPSAGQHVIFEWLDGNSSPLSYTRSLQDMAEASVQRGVSTCVPMAEWQINVCTNTADDAGTFFTADTSPTVCAQLGGNNQQRLTILDAKFYDVVPSPTIAGRSTSVLIRFFEDAVCEQPVTYDGVSASSITNGVSGENLPTHIDNQNAPGAGFGITKGYSAPTSQLFSDLAYSMKRVASSRGRNLFQMYKGPTCSQSLTSSDDIQILEKFRVMISGDTSFSAANQILRESPNGCASDIVWPREAPGCYSNSCYAQVQAYLNTCAAGPKQLPAALLEKKESCDAAVMRAQHATAINTQIPAQIETAKQEAINTALACSSQPGRMYIGNKCLMCKDTNGARLDTCQCPAGQMGVVDTSNELNVNPNMHCKACPPGTYQPLAGMLYSAVAVTSPTGNSTRRHLSTAPAASCVQCPKGTYQDMTGQSSCQPCPLGTSTTELGSSEATACATDPPDYASKSWVDNDSDPPTSIAVILVLILLGLATVALIILVIQLMNQPGGGPPGPMMPAKLLTKGQGKGPGPGMSGKGAGKMSGKGGPKKGSPGGASSGKGKGKTSGKGKGKGKK